MSLQSFPDVHNFDQWRVAARPLLSAEGRTPRISATLLNLLETLSLWRHEGRWELMYRLARRVTQENRSLLDDAADPDVRNARAIERTIHRDVHKMHAFVRFREIVQEDGGKTYLAWFEPEHLILRRGARFFVERFPNMQWTIATPDGSAVWESHELRFIDAAAPAPPAVVDGHEDLWRAYYRSICNVARINPTAMRREMPPALLEESAGGRGDPRLAARRARRTSMPVNENPRAEELPWPRPSNVRCPIRAATRHPTPVGAVICGSTPHRPSSAKGRRGPRSCWWVSSPGMRRICADDPSSARRAGSLDAARERRRGSDRATLFVTNAVKHFKWEPRGKRRLHKKPGAGEINACHVWLEREMVSVGPAVVVALGATALRALTGATLSIEAARRQELVHPTGARILATYHPSAILRAEGDRAEEWRRHLQDDLREAARIAAERRSV